MPAGAKPPRLRREPLGQSQWGAFASRSRLGSLRPPMQLAVGIPLSLQKYRRVLPLPSLMALGCTVHRCLREPYPPVGLMRQAIDTTQSGKLGCAFAPPAWRQGASSPAHSIRYPLLVNTSQSSFMKTRSESGPSALSGELSTANWGSNFPGRSPLCDCFSLQVTYPCLQGRGRFSMPLPHGLCVVTQVKP